MRPEHDQYGSQPGREVNEDLAARVRVSAPLLRSLGILPPDDAPSFDIIGDVHGCDGELRQLLAALGYEPDATTYRYTHPEGRRVVFVGDLVDRGPGVVDVLRIAWAMRQAGSALVVLGNHDHKFLRWLRGHRVRLTYGLEQTVAQFAALSGNVSAELRRQSEELCATAPGYLILDGGRLVVTHGAIRDDMLGHWDDRIASFGLYGDVLGLTDEGKPIRRDWGAIRDLDAHGGLSAPLIVYGHQVVPEARWVRRTLNLDTGCVYGGALSALRYPEDQLIQVPAERAYAVRGGSTR